MVGIEEIDELLDVLLVGQMDGEAGEQGGDHVAADDVGLAVGAAPQPGQEAVGPVAGRVDFAGEKLEDVLLVGADDDAGRGRADAAGGRGWGGDAGGVRELGVADGDPGGLDALWKKERSE